MCKNTFQGKLGSGQGIVKGNNTYIQIQIIQKGKDTQF